MKYLINVSVCFLCCCCCCCCCCCYIFYSLRAGVEIPAVWVFAPLPAHSMSTFNGTSIKQNHFLWQTLSPLPSLQSPLKLFVMCFNKYLSNYWLPEVKIRLFSNFNKGNDNNNNNNFTQGRWDWLSCNSLPCNPVVIFRVLNRLSPSTFIAVTYTS